MEDWPFACLDRDAQQPPGLETIEAVARTPHRFVFCVHAYTDDAPLAGSDAEVRLQVEDREYRWTCPASGEGRWWRVCVYDAVLGAVEDLDILTEDPPGES